MAHKKPTGRRASIPIRISAAALVAVYGPVPNKEAGLALLAAWKHLAEYGWLPSTSDDGFPSKPTIKRGVAEESRDAAKCLLRVWGPALLDSAGTYCVNPDSDPEDQVIVSAEQASRELFNAMARLAETGWLIETQVKLERFIIREYFKTLWRPTVTKTAALHELTKIYPRSIRDLERVVRGLKRPW